MPTFLHSWSPYGPSGAVEADNLDAACTVVHIAVEAIGLKVVARHLPPETPADDPLMPWEGCVLVVKSPVPRYGDNAQLHIAIYEHGQTSYHDKSRQRLEERAAMTQPPYPVA